MQNCVERKRASPSPFLILSSPLLTRVKWCHQFYVDPSRNSFHMYKHICLWRDLLILHKWKHTGLQDFFLKWLKDHSISAQLGQSHSSSRLDGGPLYRWIIFYVTSSLLMEVYIPACFGNCQECGKYIYISTSAHMYKCIGRKT